MFRRLRRFRREQITWKLLKNRRLNRKIKSCENSNQLFSLLKSRGPSFSKEQWNFYFRKIDDYFYKEIRFEANDSAVFVCILKEIAKVKVAFKVREISKMFFIYGMILEKREVVGAVCLSSLVFENFIIRHLMEHITELDSLDFYRISNGLKNSKRTRYLDQLISQIYGQLKDGFCESSRALSKIVSVFNRMSYDYGLKLWRKINFNKLGKQELIDLLISLKNILNQTNSYYDGFNFESLINRLKLLELNDAEFAVCYNIACKCDFIDEEWSSRAIRMLLYNELELNVSKLICSAINYYTMTRM